MNEIPQPLSVFVGQPWADIKNEVQALPHSSIRVMDDDEVTTMEYVSTRISVWLDVNKVVTNIGYN
jgi:hypothetical protein